MQLFFHPQDSNCKRLFKNIKENNIYSEFTYVNLSQEQAPKMIRGVPTIVFIEDGNYILYEGTSAFEFVNEKKPSAPNKNINLAVSEVMSGDVSSKISSLDEVDIKIKSPVKNPNPPKFESITEDKI